MECELEGDAMGPSDRIARLLIIPLLLLTGFLVFSERRGGDQEPTLEVLGRSTARTSVTEAEDPSETSDGATAPAPSSTAPPASDPSPPTTVADAVDLPPADAAAPPVPAKGVYRDGKLVLSGSVPTADLAAGYARRAELVLGEENVTVDMTLDARVEAETISIDVEESFRFPSGGVSFDPEFEALLNLGAAALQLLPETTLVVTGHTDDLGTEGTNIALSQARAQVVVDWMVGHGISADRVVARGAGESEPIADNTTAEGRDANRRIEAVLEGVAPG